MSAYIDLRLVNGKWLTLQRLSVFGRLEFAYHLRKAYSLLSRDPQQSIRELYARDDEFRYHSNQCFELHQIPPDLLSDDQLIALLFGSSSHPYGVLNQFNFDLSEMTQNAKSENQETKGSILGKLYRATGDVLVALELANKLPVDVLEDMFAELRPQEEKDKEKARNAISRIANPSRQ